MTRKPDSTETRTELRQRINALRVELATLAMDLEVVDHDAARHVNLARNNLFFAWSDIRKALPEEPACPLVRAALGAAGGHARVLSDREERAAERRALGGGL